MPQMSKKPKKIAATQRKIPKVFESLNESDQKLLSFVQLVRMKLTCETPLLDCVINDVLVKDLVSFLGFTWKPKMQIESAWALGKLAEGTREQKRYVMEAGAVPKLVDLLMSADLDVYTKALWALAKIGAGTSEQKIQVNEAGMVPTLASFLVSADTGVYAKAVHALLVKNGRTTELHSQLAIKFGLVQPLLALIRPADTSTEFIRDVTRTLSNLCMYNVSSFPKAIVRSQVLPALASLVAKSSDEEVFTDTCRSLSYIMEDKLLMRIDVVINSGVVPRLVHLLNLHHRSPNENNLLAALSCIKWIASGSKPQQQSLIDAHVLPVFYSLLTHPKTRVQRMTVLALSNITNGNVSQILAAILAEFVPLLVSLLSSNKLELDKKNAYYLKTFFSDPISEQMIIQDNSITIHDTDFAEKLIKCIRCILRGSRQINELELIRVYIKLLDCLDSRTLDHVKEGQPHRGEARIKLLLIEELPTMLQVADIRGSDARNIYNEILNELPLIVQVANMDMIDKLIKKRLSDILLVNPTSLKFESKGECEMPVEKIFQNVVGVLSCFICLDELADARMCPHCSKLCCAACIEHWLSGTINNTTCPHCRAPLSVSTVVRCPWASDLKQTCSFVLAHQDMCTLHPNQQVSVFCVECHTCICQLCALFDHQTATTSTNGDIRSSHTFVNLHDEYQSHKARVECSIATLRKHRVALAAQVKQQLDTFRYLRFRLEQKLAKSSKVAPALSKKQLHIKRIVEQKHQVEQMQALLDKCELELMRCSQSKLIELSGQLVNMCQRVSQRRATTVA